MPSMPIVETELTAVAKRTTSCERRFFIASRNCYSSELLLLRSKMKTVSFTRDIRGCFFVFMRSLRAVVVQILTSKFTNVSLFTQAWCHDGIRSRGDTVPCILIFGRRSGQLLTPMALLRGRSPSILIE